MSKQVDDKVQDSWLWIKDTKGHSSVTVTFLTISFFVTTVAYILSMFEEIGPLKTRAFDVAASGGYFGALCLLYYGRKKTEASISGKDASVDE